MNGVTRLRVGMLVPSSNTALEPEVSRLAALVPDLDVHFSRVRVTRISTAPASDSQFDAEPMSAAATLLGDAKVDVVAWAGTAGSWIGPERETELLSALRLATGAPATTSTVALLAGCQALGIKRVGLVTPYTEDVVTKICGTYGRSGLEVVGEAHLGIADNWSFGNVTPSQIRQLARDVGPHEADAVLVVCTNLRGTGVVAELEMELGIPVLDSIGATLWHAAIVAGRPLQLAGAGDLLAQGSLRLWLAEHTTRLLESTGADRVTVRLSDPTLGFDVDSVASEAVAPGIPAIGRERSISQWELQTVRQLQITLAPLIQERSDAPPGIPELLKARYGVRAQLLGPLDDTGELKGWISIHSSVEREWEPSDLDALATATAVVCDRLGWHSGVVAR